LCFSHFGEKVDSWITFNEPRVFVNYAYGLGTTPPCMTGVQYQATKNVLISHVLVVKAFRNGTFKLKKNSTIGITLNMRMYIPADPQNVNESSQCQNLLEAAIGIWVDPIFFAEYPKSLLLSNEAESQKLVLFTDAEKLLFKENPIDFLGINYYSSTQILESAGIFEHKSIGKPSGAEWLWSYPEGFYLILKWISNRYLPSFPNLKLAITENGCATNTLVPSWSKDVEVNDETRVEYYRDHVAQLVKAIKEGIPVVEYYAWTITDNFEWAAGYTERFGLIYVDFDDPDRKRTLKKSYFWWKSEIEKMKSAL